MKYKSYFTVILFVLFKNISLFSFFFRFPYIAISIGFLVNQTAEAGIIYNPILDEMYTAKKGKGAYCNGNKLQTTNTEGIDNVF